MKNLSVDELLKIAGQKSGNVLLPEGVLCTFTGRHTGRAPNAKAIVKDATTCDEIDWAINRDLLPAEFKAMRDKFLFYKNNRRIYSQDVWAVRDPEHSLPITVYTSHARHSLFVRNMFVPHEERSSSVFVPEWNVYHFPGLAPEPMVWISFSDKSILIAGTLYSGEIKKSVFTVLNYLFPQEGHLPMHCSVNVDTMGRNPAIFFGLSGTGKTTLSSDEDRILIGDDEHAWTESGLTNFEGGCYAKTINLSSKAEPQIYKACQTRGTILENVVLKEGVPDFKDSSITENGRASYPTSSITNSDSEGYVNQHPKNIIMLTCDAFGVLPPVSRLSAEEAVEHFLLGYTSKVAGTEAGVTEPVATFSPCFGLPFMPLPAQKYGDILKQKIEKNDVNCWLVNTGWTGGKYGVGERMPIVVTRNIVSKILDGTLAECSTIRHAQTMMSIPISEDIPKETLFPELGWEDPAAYAAAVNELMTMFEEKKCGNQQAQ